MGFLKKFLILVLFIVILIYLGKFLRKKEREAFLPTYVVSVRGNNLQLYSAIKSVSNDGYTPRLVFDSDTQRNAKLFLLNTANYTENDYRMNGLHLFTWHEVCGTSLDAILYHPLFPQLPSSKSIARKLEFEKVEENVAQHLFGLLVPPSSGKYILHIYCHDLVARVWLSDGNVPLLSSLPLFDKVCKAGDGVENHTRSAVLYLEATHSYFVSIILKTGAQNGRFNLRWSNADHRHTYDRGYAITSSSLHTLFENEILYRRATSPENPLFSATRRKLMDLYERQQNKRRSEMYKLPFIQEKDVVDLLPQCEYSPSYITTRKLGRYMGQWETHYSLVYPDDETDMPIYYQGVEKPHIMYGNTVLETKTALKTVDLIMSALDRKHGKKFTLKSLLSIEQNPDAEKGDRYLVELELECDNYSSNNAGDDDNNNDKLVRFSQYVYHPRGSSHICYPRGFAWNKKADVHYILTSAGQNRWLMHFIDTMARIYNDTKDSRMNVIIVDFSTSHNMDIIKRLQASLLPRYTLLKRRGRFHKTLAIQDAIATISDPNAIAVQVDLHLTIPSDFTDHVRKHTVQGKMAYSPLLTRLQCGATPQQPSGFWEFEGYGIFSIYKSDWDRIGGMNVRQFRDKWGGEDWDLLDSVLNHGYEVERLKMKNFNHIFHSKKNMWSSFSN